MNTITKTGIRRLTPTECERLQGFPDGWTEYGIDGKGNQVKISDTQRYKMLGNAVSVPVVQAVIERLFTRPGSEDKQIIPKEMLHVSTGIHEVPERSNVTEADDLNNICENTVSSIGEGSGENLDPSKLQEKP